MLRMCLWLPANVYKVTKVFDVFLYWYILMNNILITLSLFINSCALISKLFNIALYKILDMSNVGCDRSIVESNLVVIGGSKRINLYGVCLCIITVICYLSVASIYSSVFLSCYNHFLEPLFLWLFVNTVAWVEPCIGALALLLFYGLVVFITSLYIEQAVPSNNFFSRLYPCMDAFFDIFWCVLKITLFVLKSIRTILITYLLICVLIKSKLYKEDDYTFNLKKNFIIAYISRAILNLRFYMIRRLPLLRSRVHGKITDRFLILTILDRFVFQYIIFTLFIFTFVALLYVIAYPGAVLCSKQYKLIFGVYTSIVNPRYLVEYLILSHESISVWFCNAPGDLIKWLLLPAITVLQCLPECFNLVCVPFLSNLHVDILWTMYAICLSFYIVVVMVFLSIFKAFKVIVIYNFPCTLKSFHALNLFSIIVLKMFNDKVNYIMSLDIVKIAKIVVDVHEFIIEDILVNIISGVVLLGSRFMVDNLGSHNILIFSSIVVLVFIILGLTSTKHMAILRYFWLLIAALELFTVLSKFLHLPVNIPTLNLLRRIFNVKLYTCDEINKIMPVLNSHKSDELFYSVYNTSGDLLWQLSPLYEHKGVLFFTTVGNIFNLLVVFIFILCAYLLKDSADHLTILLFMVIEFMLLKAFTSYNLLNFYIYFETVLIPMFTLIIRKGAGGRRVMSAYLMYAYTIALSTPLLVMMVYIKTQYKTLNIFVLTEVLSKTEMSSHLFWISLFLAFSVKVPVMPFHIWLPEAHVEASTEASIILASLLLKLGLFGFACILHPIMPELSKFYSPLAKALFAISLLYSSMCAVAQVDLKKIIAYSSIAHMNFSLLALFSFTDVGLASTIFTAVSHGIVSAGLFLLVGCLFDRYNTRSIIYLGGLARVKPVFSIFFFIFSASNMGLPGTCSFVGEILGLAAIYESNKILCLFAASTTIISVIYSMLTFSKVCFGELNTTYIDKFIDLNTTECVVMSILTLVNVLLGVKPHVLLDCINFVILLQ